MKQLNNAELLATSGGFEPGFVTGLLMGNSGYGVESSVIASAVVEMSLFYIVGPYLCLYAPGYVFSLNHIGLAGMVGGGLGVLGYKFAKL